MAAPGLEQAEQEQAVEPAAAPLRLAGTEPAAAALRLAGTEPGTAAEAAPAQ